VLVYTPPPPSPQPSSSSPLPVPGPWPIPMPGPVPSPNSEPAPDPDQHIYDIIDLALRATLILVGLFWLLFGLRYMHKKPYVTLLLAGFLIFYFFSYQLLYRFTVVPRYLQNWIAYALSAVAGVIGASLFLLSYEIHVGRFFFSALSGVLFTTLLFTYTPLGAVQLAHEYQLIIIGGVGVILGIISIPLNIFIPIIVSSFNGAFIMCNAIDSLAKFSTVADLLRTIMQSSLDTNLSYVPPDAQKNWQIYVVLGVIIVTTIIGIVVQYKLTGKSTIGQLEELKVKREQEEEKNRDPEKQRLIYNLH